MLFSEAMRLGAMVKPQAFGEMRIGPSVDATCAMAAAVEGAGLPVYEYEGSAPKLPTRVSAESLTDDEFMGHVYIPDQWEMVCRVSAACPCCEFTGLVSQLIPHLNDDHRWTRERIATGIVEPIERSLGLWPLAEPTPQLETITV